MVEVCLANIYLLVYYTLLSVFITIESKIIFYDIISHVSYIQRFRYDDEYDGHECL